LVLAEEDSLGIMVMIVICIWTNVAGFGLLIVGEENTYTLTILDVGGIFLREAR
jgi:hypothetical protein